MSLEAVMLRQVPLFAELGEEALGTLASRVRRRTILEGTPVVYRGDPSGVLYVISSGQVKVHQATMSGDEMILEVLGTGDFFGEMSLLDGQPRSADVTTLEVSELLLLEGEALRETLMEHPEVAWTLLRLLSQRLRDQNDRTEMLMTRDVTGRVADSLLRLAKSHGVSHSDGHGILLDVSLTQSDIGALIGATRERVSRALSTFRASGSLEWDKKTCRWTITDPAALARRANA